MRRHRLGLALVLLLSATLAKGEAQRISVGVTPVYDGSGNVFGEVLSQHLTLFTYEELLKSPSAYPHLLSPGGVFSPMDSSWLVEYLRERDEIGLVLVATLKPEKKSGGSHSTIPVNLELLDSRSGNTLSSWSVDVEIESKKAIQEYGNVISPSRAFEKQPLGKACAKLAILIKESLETRLASVNPGRTKEISSNRAALEGTTGGGSCPVSLRITYG